MASDKLRELAALLRQEAKVVEQKKMTKSAEVLKAATALELLKQRVTPHVR